MKSEKIITSLFTQFSEVRYAAIYVEDELVYQQKEKTENSSSGETDKYEELLVNPTLLKLAEQRGNIDCGGLEHLIIKYGNFYQLVKSVPNGHVSVCIDLNSDLNRLPHEIFDYLTQRLGN